jgi:ArsR family transcriptional regulator
MDDSIKTVTNFLKILSDQKRLEIILFLKDGEKNSVEIQKAVDKPQPTISQHLKILQNESLIKSEKKNNKKYYSIKDPYIYKILSSIQSFLINLNEEKINSLQRMSIFDTLL